MNPKSPFIRTLASLPVADGITAHSIIAVKNPEASKKKWTDGVVDYSSAHIDGVASELVVHSGHSTQSEPETIEEVRRILTQHLAEEGGCEQCGNDRDSRNRRDRAVRCLHDGLGISCHILLRLAGRLSEGRPGRSFRPHHARGLLGLPRRGRTLFWFFVIFALLVVWWGTIRPSNARIWQADVSVLPYAAVAGDLVTLHNIRNFTYRTETDFDVVYYDKTFDLSKLNSVDLIAVYWMGDAIAHVMLSFGFGDADYVAFSIEARKETHEGYSSVKGFFKQYELIYVVADERDVIRLRTDYRNPQEDVYLYRTRITPENARRLFLEYVEQINNLKDEPEFYNTLTTNCTTNVVRHIRAFGGKVTYSWKILLSGYAPQYAYERGGLDTSLTFEELRKRSYINPRAHTIGNVPEFSRRIREDLP